MTTTTQMVAGSIIVLLIVSIVLTVFYVPSACAQKSSTSAAPKEDAKAPTRLVKESAPHDKFFSSGLGYMGDMKTSDIEKEYMQYMTTTGGGYYHLNPLQLQAEISRIVDDKMTTGTQIQNKQRPAFDRKKGYLKGAVDEKNVKTVKA